MRRPKPGHTGVGGGRLLRWMRGVVVLLLVGLFVGAGQPAFAAPTDEQLEKANQICKKVDEENPPGGGLRPVATPECQKAVANQIEKIAAGGQFDKNSFCNDFKFNGPQCDNAVNLFQSKIEAAAKPAPAAGAAGECPAGQGQAECAMGKLLKMMQDQGTKLAGYTLGSLDAKNTVGPGFNINNAGFLANYAYGFGIAIIVMILLLVKLFVQAARRPEETGSMRQSLFIYLPIGLFLCIFGPMVGWELAQLSDTLANSIASSFGFSEKGGKTKVLGDAVGALIKAPSLAELPLITLPLLVATVATLVGLLAVLILQSMALYLTGAIMAIAFIAMMDPRLRRGAMRLPLTWLAVLFTKPILFFGLAVVLSIFSGKLEGDVRTSIINLIAVTAGLGLAIMLPFTVFKLLPKVPAFAMEKNDESNSKVSSGNAGATGAVGTMVNVGQSRAVAANSGVGGVGLSSGLGGGGSIGGVGTGGAGLMGAGSGAFARMGSGLGGAGSMRGAMSSAGMSGMMTPGAAGSYSRITGESSVGSMSRITSAVSAGGVSGMGMGGMGGAGGVSMTGFGGSGARIMGSIDGGSGMGGSTPRSAGARITGSGPGSAGVATDPGASGRIDFGKPNSGKGGAAGRASVGGSDQARGRASAPRNEG